MKKLLVVSTLVTWRWTFPGKNQPKLSLASSPGHSRLFNVACTQEKERKLYEARLSFRDSRMIVLRLFRVCFCQVKTKGFDISLIEGLYLVPRLGR